MGPYRQIMISFWTDSFVSDHFGAEDKYFFLYALTNIHTNLCGCYDVSFKQMSEETGLTTDSIAAIVERFDKSFHLIKYDKDTREMLILNWSKHNWTESPKFRKYLRKEIESIKNDEFKSFLLGKLDGKYDSEYGFKTTDTLSRVDDTFVSMVIDNSNSKDSNFSNSNNDINLENVNTDKEVKKRVRKKYEDTPEFTEFWNAYPKQKDKTKAREEFARVDVPLDVLLSALEIQKRSHDWTKEGGTYIPYPAKWLKYRRWEDSMEVNVQSEGRYDNLKRIAEEFGDD